ncbi:MAG TPA: hypothetical protein VFX82_14335 [Desulfobacterales bacterium]|nr:hypothetical protein [Desulfobacterales bacterium]
MPDARWQGVIGAPLDCRLTALNRDTPHNGPTPCGCGQPGS